MISEKLSKTGNWQSPETSAPDNSCTIRGKSYVVAICGTVRTSERRASITEPSISAQTGGTCCPVDTEADLCYHYDFL